MADSATQSSQISSSQGLNDGHSATTKESSNSDSFFSSSPASLIQSPQDKRVVLGSDKSSEGVATSLRFSSQPSSFSRVTYANESSGPPGGSIERSFQEKRELFESSLASQQQDSSPIKVSPVSERIKALEALAARQNDSDWSDGFPHFRERHYEKSPTEGRGISSRSSIKKRATSPEQDSPDSPFEVLGDGRRGSDFEDTADWMRAHLPPAPTFNTEESDFDEMKEASAPQEEPAEEIKHKETDAPDVPESFVGVPDEFLDTPADVVKQVVDGKRTKQDSVEDESEFDLRFLPTAYMWEKQEKSEMETQDLSGLPETQDSEIPASPALPAEFESPSMPSPPPAPKPDSTVEQQPATHDDGSEPAEILEIDSSGESDDTVIEDASNNPHAAVTESAPESGLPKDKRETLSKEQEKQFIQVPIINVIETLEEQVLSDYEVQHDDEDEDDDDDDDEKYQIRRIPETEAPKPSDDHSEVSKSASEEVSSEKEEIPSETNVKNSNAEYSPKHEIIIDDVNKENFNQTDLDSESPVPEDLEAQSEVVQNTDVTLNESTIHTVRSDNDEEITPQLPPSYEDLSNEIVSSDIDTYLDHYTSQELALKDQLNSGIFTENDGDSEELLKSSSLQNSQNNTESAQQSFEQTVVDEFDEILNENKLNSDTVPESSFSDFLEDVHVEPVTSEMADVEQEDRGVELEEQKTTTTSETYSLVENDYTSQPAIHPSLDENIPAPFPSFHNDPASKISEVISDFVVNDISDGLVVTKPEQGDLIESDTLDRQIFPESPSEAENAEAECTPSAASDSFVEFMRECLKSRQEEEPEIPTMDDASVASPPPAMIMDLEQERLTISALKELGSSQEEEDEIDVPNKRLSVSSMDQASQPPPNLESSTATVPTSYLSNETRPEVLLAKEVEAFDIWVAEAYHLAEHVLAAILTHLSVCDLVHWRDPKKSGVVFGTSLLLLLSLAAFSVISVVSYLLLALLTVTITFRIYKSVIQAVQKSSEGHPFKALMEKDVSVPPETFRKHVDVCLTYINRALKQMSRLFLVEDLVDSLKLAVVMWLLTYVGAVFNGITLLILVDILLFSVPPLYEKNKTQIDRYIDMARTQVNATMAKLQEKLPGALKRSKTE